MLQKSKFLLENHSFPLNFFIKMQFKHCLEALPSLYQSSMHHRREEEARIQLFYGNSFYILIEDSSI